MLFGHALTGLMASCQVSAVAGPQLLGMKFTAEKHRRLTRVPANRNVNVNDKRPGCCRSRLGVTIGTTSHCQL